MTNNGIRPTVILVHGAFADGSSWNEVIAELQADRTPARALAHPLRGLYSDAAYVAHAAAQSMDPCFSLATPTAHGHHRRRRPSPNVIGLVYIAAFIPERGESLASINAGYPTTTTPPRLVERTFPASGNGEPQVELSISAETFPTAFAADLPIEVTRVAAATQRPPALACFEQVATRTAWRELPSWAVVRSGAVRW